MDAPVSMMKLKGRATPSTWTSPLRNPLDVERVADVLAVEDAAREIAVGEDGGLVRQLDLFEPPDELEVAGAVRLGHALQLALDERRDDGAVLRQLALPPADRQVTAERLAVVQVGSDNRSLKV